jgi:hypothetical protein
MNMKLYELPRKTKFILLEDVDGPVSALKPNKNEEYFLDHLDGMYSLCYNNKNAIIYIPAWAEVQIVEEN